MPQATAGDGTRIAYELCGREDGEPLVLIQGLSADRRGWLRQRGTLGECSHPTSGQGDGADVVVEGQVAVGVGGDLEGQELGGAGQGGGEGGVGGVAAGGDADQ